MEKLGFAKPNCLGTFGHFWDFSFLRQELALLVAEYGHFISTVLQSLGLMDLIVCFI